MENQNKPRLSQVAKKNTTDRASKLASSFLPSPPAATTPPPVVIADSSAKSVEVENLAVEEKVTEDSKLLTPVIESAPQEKPVLEKPKERTRRSTATINLIETINQPVPDGLRCTRMIMLSDEHHDLLRELSFKFKKPMTAILYNLIEPANQANEREKQKGGPNHV